MKKEKKFLKALITAIKHSYNMDEVANNFLFDKNFEIIVEIKIELKMQIKF